MLFSLICCFLCCHVAFCLSLVYKSIPVLHVMLILLQLHQVLDAGIMFTVLSLSLQVSRVHQVFWDWGAG